MNCHSVVLGGQISPSRSPFYASDGLLDLAERAHWVKVSFGRALLRVPSSFCMVETFEDSFASYTSTRSRPSSFRIELALACVVWPDLSCGSETLSSFTTLLISELASHFVRTYIDMRMNLYMKSQRNKKKNELKNKQAPSNSPSICWRRMTLPCALLLPIVLRLVTTNDSRHLEAMTYK